MKIGESAGFTFRYVGIARQVGRQLAAGGIDRRLHIARRGVDVAVQIELQRDARRARASWTRSSP